MGKRSKVTVSVGWWWPTWGGGNGPIEAQRLDIRRKMREREFRCEMGEERLEMDRRERRLNTVILVAAGAFLAGSTRGGRLKSDSLNVTSDRQTL